MLIALITVATLLLASLELWGFWLLAERDGRGRAADAPKLSKRDELDS